MSTTHEEGRFNLSAWALRHQALVVFLIALATAFGILALACVHAQSIHGVSAATSEPSTVQPHQMRRPGGASRWVAIS